MNLNTYIVGRQKKAFHMLQLVVHPAVKRFPYGLSNIYTSLGTVTTFSNVAHTYYCFRFTSYFVHNHVTLNNVYTPLHFFTDQSDWFIESCGKVKNITNHCMYYSASPDFNFLFVFNLSNISSYTKSRYIQIVFVMVSIRTSRFSYIINTFWWTIFRVLWFENVWWSDKNRI